MKRLIIIIALFLAHTAVAAQSYHYLFEGHRFGDIKQDQEQNLRSFVESILELEKDYNINAHKLLEALSCFFPEERISNPRILSNIVSEVSEKYGQNITTILLGNSRTESIWKSMLPISAGTINFRFFQRSYQRALLSEGTIYALNENYFLIFPAPLWQVSSFITIDSLSYMQSFDWESILESLHQ